MKEELVNFKIAKLAKKKGFDVEVYQFYDSFKALSSAPIEMSDDNLQITYDNFNDPKEFHDLVSAPTQSLLQKWLREKHGIFISIHNDITNDWQYEIRSGYPEASYIGVALYSKYTYLVYETALEEALKKALKLIE